MQRRGGLGERVGFQINGFGTAPISRTRSRTPFECPNTGCKSHRTGETPELQLRSARNWFTMLYLPVIPLGDLGMHARCSRCKTQFTMDLLHHIAPHAFQSSRSHLSDTGPT